MRFVKCGCIDDSFCDLLADFVLEEQSCLNIIFLHNKYTVNKLTLSCAAITNVVSMKIDNGLSNDLSTRYETCTDNLVNEGAVPKQCHLFFIVIGKDFCYICTYVVKELYPTSQYHFNNSFVKVVTYLKK